jgi:hypothetical protein
MAQNSFINSNKKGIRRLGEEGGVNFRGLGGRRVAPAAQDGNNEIREVVDATRFNALTGIMEKHLSRHTIRNGRVIKIEGSFQNNGLGWQPIVGVEFFHWFRVEKHSSTQLRVRNGTLSYWGMGSPISQVNQPLELTLGKTITKIDVLDGGRKYTAAPSIQLLGGDGTGATASSVISNGKVTAINVTAAGSNYTIPPRVRIVGGNGYGGFASAAIGDLFIPIPANDAFIVMSVDNILNPSSLSVGEYVSVPAETSQQSRKYFPLAHIKKDGTRLKGIFDLRHRWTFEQGTTSSSGLPFEAVVGSATNKIRITSGRMMFNYQSLIHEPTLFNELTVPDNTSKTVALLVDYDIPTGSHSLVPTLYPVSQDSYTTSNATPHFLHRILPIADVQNVNGSITAITDRRGEWMFELPMQHYPALEVVATGLLDIFVTTGTIMINGVPAVLPIADSYGKLQGKKFTLAPNTGTYVWLEPTVSPFALPTADFLLFSSTATLTANAQTTQPTVAANTCPAIFYWPLALVTTNSERIVFIDRSRRAIASMNTYSFTV